MPECGKPVVAKGYCNRHYYRLRRTGSVELQRREYVHGRTGYQRGCKCDICVEANRANSLRWSRGLIGNPELHQHGDPRRYRHGCRCLPCWNAYRDHVATLRPWPLDTLSDVWRELADRPAPFAAPLHKHTVEWWDPVADEAIDNVMREAEPLSWELLSA